MHGFFGSYGKAANWDLDSFSASLVKRTYENSPMQLTQITLPKFLGDKYFAEYDDCFIATEGVLFEADSAEEAISRYRKGETTFWERWRGSFAGVLYDKREEKLLLFNDHIGSKMLFYALAHGEFIFASDLKILAHAVGADTPNKPFVRRMLDKGYMNDNSTFVQNVFRLMAGEYICMTKNHFERLSYHRFDNTPYLYNEAEMIEKTNTLFRQAVARVIRKNESEGLQHFFPLSGGLDSRMCQLIAHEYATQPITNFTYSQTNHYDHLLPQEISRSLGNQWQFMALDGGSYLAKIDEIAAATEWLVNYNGPSEIYAFASQQDWTDKGVVLTGVNGDSILTSIAYGQKEIDLLYALSFGGNGLGSPLVLQHYSESYSPFCDVDVLEYILHIPATQRRYYGFYDKWILACYPQAVQWHHKHEQIGHRKTIVTILGRDIPLQELPRRLFRYAFKRIPAIAGEYAQGDSMNPYDDWAKNNPQLLKMLNAYYETYRPLLPEALFTAECNRIMQTAPIMEKCKVLTILSALKAFARNDKSRN